MASLDFRKFTTKAMKGMSVHFDQSKRMNLNHSNEDINKNLVSENELVFGKSYEEVLQTLENDLIEIDKIAPPKRINKDRITTIGIEFPFPEGINENEFMKMSLEFFEEKGIKIAGGVIHRDESHYYINSKNEIEKSKNHAHLFFCPCSKEKRADGTMYGCNAKKFMDKKFLFNIQKDFNDKVYQTFGIEYFTRDNNRANGLSVEELKKISKQVQKINDTMELLSKKNIQLRMELEQEHYLNSKHYKKIQEQIEQNEQVLDTLSNSKQILSSEIKKQEIKSNKKAIDEKALSRTSEKVKNKIKQKGIEL